MTLYQLLAQFIRQHWRSYVAAAVMLFLVAALTVLIPRKIGQIIDAMVAHNLAGEALIWELATVLLMGVAIYFLRVGWRLQLFAASYRLGAQLRLRLYQRLSMQGPAFFQQQRTGDLMALGTNDADAIELAAGEAALAGFEEVEGRGRAGTADVQHQAGAARRRGRRPAHRVLQLFRPRRNRLPGPVLRHHPAPRGRNLSGGTGDRAAVPRLGERSRRGRPADAPGRARSGRPDRRQGRTQAR